MNQRYANNHPSLKPDNGNSRISQRPMSYTNTQYPYPGLDMTNSQSHYPNVTQYRRSHGHSENYNLPEIQFEENNCNPIKQHQMNPQQKGISGVMAHGFQSQMHRMPQVNHALNSQLPVTQYPNYYNSGTQHQRINHQQAFNQETFPTQYQTTQVMNHQAYNSQFSPTPYQPMVNSQNHFPAPGSSYGNTMPSYNGSSLREGMMQNTSKKLTSNENYNSMPKMLPPTQNASKTSNTTVAVRSYTQMPKSQSATSNHSAQLPKKAPAKADSFEKIFISVNFSGLVTFSAYKSKFLPVFEVMGIVDSRVSEISGGKSFFLRDGQGVRIKCIFYEVDRQLEELYRGSSYRCVGEYKVKSENFLCVSVRPTNAIEIRAHKKLVAKTALALKSRYPNPT